MTNISSQREGATAVLSPKNLKTKINTKKEKNGGNSRKKKIGKIVANIPNLGILKLGGGKSRNSNICMKKKT